MVSKLSILEDRIYKLSRTPFDDRYHVTNATLGFFIVLDNLNLRSRYSFYEFSEIINYNK